MAFTAVFVGERFARFTTEDAEGVTEESRRGARSEGPQRIAEPYGEGALRI